MLCQPKQFGTAANVQHLCDNITLEFDAWPYKEILLYASSAHSRTKAVEKKINRDTNLVWNSLYELESANHL